MYLTVARTILWTLALCSCSTIATVPTEHETIVATRPVQSSGRDPKLRATVTQDDGIAIVLARDETCTVHQENTVRRTRTLHRRIDSKANLVLEFALGAAALGGGVGVVYDAPNVPASGDPMTTNPIGRTGAYGIGVGLLALGVAGVVVGFVDLRRTRDGTEDLGTDSRPTNDVPRDVRCNEGMSAGTALVLRAGANPGAASARHDDLNLGATDARGKLVVPWSSIPSDWLNTAGWVRTATVVAGGTELVALPLDRARALVAEETWVKTKATNGAAGYRVFLDNFPEAHHDEAITAYRTTRVPELETDSAAAASAKDVKRAESAVEEWAALDPENPKLADARARAKELKLDELLAQADKRLSAANKDHIDDLNEAQAELEQATALVKPEDARISKRTKRLAQVKTQVIVALVADSRRKAANGDFDGASGSVDAAARLGPDRKEVADARANVERLQKQAADRAERLQKAADEKEQRRIDCLDKCINGKEDFSCSTDNGYGEWMLCRAPHCARRCNGK